MKALLRQVGRWLVTKPEKYCPDFGDDSFLNVLGISGALRQHPALARAIEKRETGLSETIRYEIVQHFVARSKFSFFVDVNRIPDLASKVRSQHPTWCALAIAKAEKDCRQGLEIYESKGPPLQPGFPWSEPVRGARADPLYRARPQRFAFAPRLALAGLYGSPSCQWLRDILQDWKRFAETSDSDLPYLSTLVVIQRVLALSWAWAFAAANRVAAMTDDVTLEYEILKDICFLAPRLGQSYPNNHLLVDAFGGWYISNVFPEFVRDRADSARLETLWLSELERQILRDGSSFEHSLHYHEFACEMVSAYLLLKRKQREPESRMVTDRAERMLRFQASMGGTEGVATSFGNATEDPLFPLDSGPGDCNGALRELLRALFDQHEEPSPPSNLARERAYWMLAGEIPDSGLPTHSEKSMGAYPDGGYFVLCDSITDERLIFRTGPAKHHPICAGHMHSDLLSISLLVGSIPVLVDSGTYTYRFTRGQGTNWRAYFAGPSAHNGPVVGSTDAVGILAGDFRERDAAVRVTSTYASSHASSQAFHLVEGSIEESAGYTGYRRGVVHASGEYWLVYDVLPKVISCPISQGLQFSASSVVEQDTSKRFKIINCGKELLSISTWALSSSKIHLGSKEPTAGWISPRYGELLPAPQIRFVPDAGAPLTAMVFGSFGLEAGEPQLIAACVFPGGVGFILESGDIRDYILIGREEGPCEVREWDMRFSAAILRLRVSGARPASLKWLSGRSFVSKTYGIEIENSSSISELEMLMDGTSRVGPLDPSPSSITWPGLAGV
jgi:hypothetical protein